MYMPYKMCMFQLLPGCNVARMQRYTVDIHRQGNTATRCLRSFHAMLAVTAGDSEGVTTRYTARVGLVQHKRF